MCSPSPCRKRTGCLVAPQIVIDFIDYIYHTSWVCSTEPCPIESEKVIKFWLPCCSQFCGKWFKFDYIDKGRNPYIDTRDIFNFEDLVERMLCPWSSPRRRWPCFKEMSSTLPSTTHFMLMLNTCYDHFATTMHSELTHSELYINEHHDRHISPILQRHHPHSVAILPTRQRPSRGDSNTRVGRTTFGALYKMNC